jgi:hypothetical protein
MILQVELMPQIKIVLGKMLIHLVNIIHLNLEPVDVFCSLSNFFFNKLIFGCVKN